MPNVNNVDCGQSARVYHASTVERSLPQLRGRRWGLVWFFFSFSSCVALGAPPSHATPTPAPTECQRAPIPQYPRPQDPPSSTQHCTGAPSERGAQTGGHNPYFETPLHPPPLPTHPAAPSQPNYPPHAPPTPLQFVLIYLFRRVFEVEAFFHLLEFSPSPFDAPPPVIEKKSCTV